MKRNMIMGTEEIISCSFSSRGDIKGYVGVAIEFL